MKRLDTSEAGEVQAKRIGMSRRKDKVRAELAG
jgi:hypothetical protein